MAIGDEFEELARQTVAEYGVPEGDWRSLASALRNGAARDRALEDPYWRELVNLDADEWSGQDADDSMEGGS